MPSRLIDLIYLVVLSASRCKPLIVEELLEFMQSFHEYQFFKHTNRNYLKQNGWVSDVCALK